jgi:maltose alpha-D-glucosyltransferase/alpha-amylase
MAERKAAPTQAVAPRESLTIDLAAGAWTALLEGHAQSLFHSALQSWLPRQRWFGAKARSIQSIRVACWFEIPQPAPDLGSLQTPSPFVIALIEVGFASGPAETYQLPLALTIAADAKAWRKIQPRCVLASFESTLGPAFLCDATCSEEFRQSLLSLIERNSTLELSAAASEPISAQSQSDDYPSTRRIAAKSSNAFSSVRGFGPLSSRVGSVEQSNTSILYGHRLILKLFRRVQPGENPEVEVGRFLTQTANSPRIAPFLGDIAIESPPGEVTTLAILQGFVASQGDGWHWFLDRLAEFFEAVSSQPVPQRSSAHAPHDPAESALQANALAEPTLQAAALLGRRTAELHLALATPTSNPAFASEPFTAADLAADAARIAAQIASALDALQAKLPAIGDSIVGDAARLLSQRPRLLARAANIAALKPAGERIRIHGDYHLGQTLRTAGSASAPADFILLDFEGEPARPLSERRQKQSPLKDVAGMMRSLSYVAFAALDRHRTEHPTASVDANADSIAEWASLWQKAATQVFLHAWRNAIAVNPALLPSNHWPKSLLDAYILEKALYELLYELNNRPAWLHIPLSGILAL